MLRQILTTVLLILIPYVVYGIIATIRRRITARATDPAPASASAGFWSGAPVLVLGLIGCVLAVAVLIAISVMDNDPSKPRYVPPVNAEQS